MADRKPVSAQDQAKLLNAVLDACRGADHATPAAVIFDLDGTLHDNRPRTSAIMRELAERWRNAHPDASEKLRRMDPNKLDYLLADNLRNYGIDDEALHEEALKFWMSRFFFDDAMEHDVAHPGAVEFARACHEAGGVLIYFTGRDLPNMALGTLKSLRDLGFPICVPRTQLVLKPDFETPDDEFKREVMPELGRGVNVVACFENEPGNCNIFHDLFPRAEVFLVDTQHVPTAPPLAEAVHVIADFKI